MLKGPPKLPPSRNSDSVADAVDGVRRVSGGARDGIRSVLRPDSSLPHAIENTTARTVNGRMPFPGADKNTFSIKPETLHTPSAEKTTEATAAKATETTTAKPAPGSSYASSPLTGLDKFDAKVMGPAQTVVGVAGMLPMGLGAIGLLGKMVAAPLGWVGAKNTAQKIRDLAAKPGALSNYTISESLGERTVQMGSDAIGAFEKPIESLGNATGYNAYRIKSYTAKAEKSLTKMGEAASRLERAAVEVHPHIDSSLRGHINTLTSSVGKTASALNITATGEAVAEIEKAAKANSALSVLSKHAGKLHESAVLATEHSASAVSLGSSVRTAAKEFGKGSLMHAATNTAFVGMDAISLYETGRGFQHDMDNFAKLCMDVKGLNQKPSLSKMAFMDLPPSLTVVRGELFKQYASQFGVRALGAAINLRGIMKGKFNQWIWGAQFAGSMAVDGLVGGRGLLNTYNTLNDGFKSGQALAVDDYAALLVAGCKDCMDRKGGVANPVIHELAKQLAEMKLSPAEVLQKSDNGEISKMIAGITVTGEHHEKAAVAEAAPAVSYVEKVGGPSQRVHAPAQPVAAFTAKAAPTSFTARENLKPETTAAVPSIG